MVPEWSRMRIRWMDWRSRIIYKLRIMIGEEVLGKMIYNPPFLVVSLAVETPISKNGPSSRWKIPEAST